MGKRFAYVCGASQEMTKNLLDIMGDEAEGGGAAAAKGGPGDGTRKAADEGRASGAGSGASSNVMSMVTQQREIMQGRMAEAGSDAKRVR